jgi:membrane protease YdiL (CAAX protease family)
VDRAPRHRQGLCRTRGATLTTDAEQLPDRRTLIAEVWIVLLISLGFRAIYALVDLIADLTKGAPLSSQTAVLVGSQSDRPWLDLVYQLLGITRALVPVALVIYLLHRSGESAKTIGFDLRRPRVDLAAGAALAAVIGGAGLGLYLIAHAVDSNLTVVPTTLRDVWWRIPVLILAAAENAVLEEVVIAGYLLHRLRQIGWSDGKALALSAGVRGSYHFYQGFGGFLGNAVMGVIFGRIYQRYGRVGPLIVAHTLMDAVAFVGYVVLAGHVSWLPTP